MSTLKIILQVRKLSKPPPRITYQISEICKESIVSKIGKESIGSIGVSLQLNHFFVVHSNFSYDSEAYDLIKLYLETLHLESGRTTAVELFCGKLINLL